MKREAWLSIFDGDFLKKLIFWGGKRLNLNRRRRASCLAEGTNIGRGEKGEKRQRSPFLFCKKINFYRQENRTEFSRETVSMRPG